MVVVGVGAPASLTAGREKLGLLPVETLTPAELF